MRGNGNENERRGSKTDNPNRIFQIGKKCGLEAYCLGFEADRAKIGGC